MTAPFNTFLKKLEKDGVAKSYLMDVEITKPAVMSRDESEHLKFKCEDAELPGKTFETSTVKDYVINRKPVLGVSYAGPVLVYGGYD